MNDDDSFARFYEATRDACLQALVASGVDHHIAEDALAEAFARAYARWADVSKHPVPRAWVIRTALNAATSSWRRTRREVLSAGVPDRIRPQQDVGIADVEMASEIAALPRRQREVVALRIVLDLDAASTAVALGISPNTVGVHLHRALTTLRERLLASRQEEPQP